MTKEKKILLVIIVNTIIVLSEIAFGLISNSYALIADALHNAGDVLAVIITYIAIKFSTKTSTFRETFGYIRAEMMAAFVNSMFLFVTMLFVIYEAINRLINPDIIEPIYMISVGLIAMIANGISAYVLNNLGVSHHHHADDDEHTHRHHHGHTHSHSHTHKNEESEDANIKSAYLHMLGDALISVAVVTAGVFIYFFKIYSIDSILTLIFSAYILYQTYPLLKKSFLSLMDINITTISKEKLDKIILSDKNIFEYHDLHIYKPSSKLSYISFHIVFKDNNLSLESIETITNKIKEKLKKEDFGHILIQVDSIKNIQNCSDCTKEH